jgi:uncharacterized DUF497 family protein
VPLFSLRVALSAEKWRISGAGDTWPKYVMLFRAQWHGVSLASAQRVFADTSALMIQDRVEQGEERWQAIGRVGAHTVLVVAHVVRMRGDEEVLRIISARYALKHERERYETETQ